eukprot:12577033-Prorocentrum_lima.AAC.1
MNVIHISNAGVEVSGGPYVVRPDMDVLMSLNRGEGVPKREDDKASWQLSKSVFNGRKRESDPR